MCPEHVSLMLSSPKRGKLIVGAMLTATDNSGGYLFFTCGIMWLFVMVVGMSQRMSTSSCFWKYAFLPKWITILIFYDLYNIVIIYRNPTRCHQFCYCHRPLTCKVIPVDICTLVGSVKYAQYTVTHFSGVFTVTYLHHSNPIQSLIRTKLKWHFYIYIFFILHKCWHLVQTDTIITKYEILYLKHCKCWNLNM